jgi:hypothetical protein
VGFVVDKVALGKLFLQILWFSSVIINPPVLHIVISFICYQTYIIIGTDSVVKWNISLSLPSRVHFSACDVHLL